MGFIVGALGATFHLPFWWRLPSLGVVRLGDQLGWVVAVGVQLVVCAAIAAATWRTERRLRPTLIPVLRRRWDWQFLWRGPWPLLAGAAGLALLNALTLLLAGHPWSITWAFSLWGAKVLQAVGYDLAQTPFWSGTFQQQALAAPVLADSVSVMDMGIVIGALLAAGLAGRFHPTLKVHGRVLCSSFVGGLLLGYGARIAFGCNIGAYFSGVASGSLHGWLWLLGAALGTPLGVKLSTAYRD